MKNKMTNILRNLILPSMVLLASCLPQQPSDPKCSKGTEYSSATRTCNSIAGVNSQSNSTPIFGASTPTNADPTITTLITLHNFTVSIYNPSNTNYLIRWYVDLSEQSNYRSNLIFPAVPLTEPFPTAGKTYNVTAKLFSTDLAKVYDIKSWAFTITRPGLTSITSADPQNLGLITAIDRTSSGSAYWSYNSIPATNPSITVASAAGSDGTSGVRVDFYNNSAPWGSICKTSAGSTNFALSEATAVFGTCPSGGIRGSLTVKLGNPNTAESGTYFITAVAYDVYTGTQIGFTPTTTGATLNWPLNIIPKPVTTITAPSSNQVKTIYDGTVPSTWTAGAPAITVDSATNNGGAGSNSSSGVEVVFYEGTSASVSGVLQTTMLNSTSHTATLSDTSAATFSNLAIGAKNLAVVKSIYAEVKDAYRNYLIGARTWTITIQPKPIPQITSITTRGGDSCTGSVVNHVGNMFTHTNYVCTWAITAIDSFNLGSVTASEQWYWTTSTSIDPRVGGAWAGNRIDVTDAPEIVLSAVNNGFNGSDGTSGVRLDVYDDTTLINSYVTTSNTINLASIAPLLSVSNSDPLALEDTKKLKMTLVDVYTGLEIGYANWPLRKRQKNSPPSIVAGTFLPATTTISVSQTSTNTFSATSYDDDTANAALNFSYRVNGVLANNSGTTYYPNVSLAGTGSTLPNCVSTGSPTCSLTFPAFDDDGPIAAPTGVLVTTEITDVALNGDPAKTTYSASSPVTSWTVNVTEVETAPIVTNVQLLNPGAVSTITEGATAAQVSFDVTDAECDNFKYSVELQVDVGGTMTTVFQPLKDVVVTRTDCSPLLTSITSAAFVIPQYLNDPRNNSHNPLGQIMYIKVTVTDITDSASALSNSYTNTGLTIIDNNPYTTMISGTLNPTIISDHIIQAGSMFVIDPGNLTSGNTIADGKNALFTASTYAKNTELTSYDTNQGNKLIYQWQVNANTTSNCSVGGSWRNIPGAATATPTAGPVNPKLVWTPPRQNGSVTYCFRLCVGDDGYGHPADCSGTSTKIGTWSGSANSFAVNPPSVEKTIHTGTTSNPHLASFQSTTGLVNYTALADGSNIRVVKSVYTAASGTIASTSGATVSDGVALTNDAPTNFSIAGTGDDATGKIYVAYQIYDGDGYAPLYYNVIRVRCFTRGTLLQDCGSWNYDAVTQKIGNISIDATYWYLPYIDKDNSYQVGLIWTELANTSSVDPVVIGEVANTNIRVREFATNTPTNSLSVQGFIDPTNNLYSMLIETQYDHQLITYTTAAIRNNPFSDSTAAPTIQTMILPAGSTRLTGIMGTTKFFVGAISINGDFLLRRIPLAATYIPDPITYAFTGLNAHVNSAINLGFHSNSSGDSAESPMFIFGNGSNGNITYYKVNYPITSGTISSSLTASKQTINSTAATFGGNNGKLSTTKSYLVQMGTNGSVGNQTHFTNWVTYSSGFNVYQGIVNLDPFTTVAGSVTTTNTADSDTTGVGVPFW